MREVALPLHTEDWRGFDAAEQRDRLAAFLHADAARGFDLATPPLTRLALLRLGDDEWRFVWSHHHLQIDGWSWPIVFRDVATIYCGQPLSPARPYGDFIAWQQRRGAADGDNFWREKLRGFCRATPLPGRASGQGAKGVHESSLSLSPADSTALEALARRHHTTTNVLVQTAWALILCRQSGERDVVFGASFSGRPPELAGAEDMVGHFVNNVPVRITIDPSAPLEAHLRKAHAELFELDDHQYTPLAQIQSCSELPWHARLFESLLVFQNYLIDDRAMRLGNDAVFADPVTPVRTNYPLTIVFEQGRQLRISVIAAARNFTTDAAIAFRDQLASVLSAMAGRTAATLGDLLALLPAPSAGRTTESRPSGEFAAPHTATERAIAALWEEAFGIDRVGIRDNFFDLGGHSLLMLRVHAKLRDTLKTDISIVRMFQHPTIQSLARHLDGAADGTARMAGIQARAEKQKAALARQQSLVRK
jgi:hypothetical protein